MNNVFWYTLQEPRKTGPLTGDMTVDAVVIGGGVAGLTTAQALHAQGLSVVLLEKDFCGSGASGKSSGFIAADAELGLRDFTHHFGKKRAQELWQFGSGGVEHIRQNILNYELKCDYKVQDSLFIANNKSGYAEVKDEFKAQKQDGYQVDLYDQQKIKTIIGSDQFYGGVRYGHTFGMSAYLYCQGLQSQLQQAGVHIYTQTEAIKIEANQVHTDRYRLSAGAIIVCADYQVAGLGLLRSDVYHVQTFIGVTKPLSDSQVQRMFPTGNLMVWDTDLVFNYFRIIGNNRLLIGGGDIWNTYARGQNCHASSINQKLLDYVAKKFPYITGQFDHFWPGLIGITKDLVPLAGQDTKNPNLYYISGATGLAWATALGLYISQKIVNKRADLDPVFDPGHYRPLSSYWSYLIGTQATFALSNLKSKFLTKNYKI